MNQPKPLQPLLVLLGLALAGAVAPTSAHAQSTCAEPLCSAGDSYERGGTDWMGPYGVCKGCNWLGHCSHTITRCPTGYTLDIGTGTCRLDACGGCGYESPLCDAGEVYQRSGTDAAGTYGVCGNAKGGWGSYLYHRIVRCEEGWTLQTSTGMCKRDCKPDLVLRRVYLRDASYQEVTEVPAYQPYYVCFEAANLGAATSGNFVVRGGGLAVSPAPQQTQYRLTPGQRRSGCLYYPYTPYPGTWRIGVTVDADDTNEESEEGNNQAVVTVRVGG